MRQIAEREAPADAGQREDDAIADAVVVATTRRRRTPAAGSSCLVEAEQMEDDRPGRRQEDQEQDVLDGDARREEAVHSDRHRRQLTLISTPSTDDQRPDCRGTR